LRSPERALAVRQQVPLASLSTLGIGGPARWFTRAQTVDEIAEAHHWAAGRGTAVFVLGGGSNLVIADAGFEGLVLHVALGGVAFTEQGGTTLVRAGAGERWDDLVAAVVARGLAGVECLSGIPGSVGGTPIQNVGAYGQDVSDTIESVTVFDRRSAVTTTLNNEECRFAYRMSRFKREDAGRFIVCDVVFALRPGPPTLTYADVVRYFQSRGISTPTLAETRAGILEIRRRKGMVLDAADPDTRSVGSFFMNPVLPSAVHARLASAGARAPGFILPDGTVKVPAAWLIEQAGFAKGSGTGRVGLSTKHPLALVNRGGASASDVVAFAVRIKEEVEDRFGVSLRPEPVFLGFGDDRGVAYLQKAHD
jgi:UDP-N-acetylmuramate dehydrogenase